MEQIIGTNTREELLSKDDILALASTDFKKRIDDRYVTLINAALFDTEAPILETYKENLFSYTHVLATGKYKIENYINAVKYVGYKMMKYTNRDAFKATFPRRTTEIYEYYRERGFTDTQIADQKISPYVHDYNGSKLVNEIYKQVQIPAHILNYATFQKAVNVQADLMVNAESDRVRSDAADSLLNHLKAPEAMKMEVEIGFKENDAIAELRKATEALSIEQQSKIIRKEASSLQIAESIIIEAEVEEI